MNPPDPSSSDGGFSLDDLQAGFLVGGGRYTLNQLFWSGRLSSIWIAADHQLSEAVALKFFAGSLTSERGALQDFLHEVQKCRKLSHPNLVRIHDLYHSREELLFVTTEYVAGTSLQDLRLSWPDQVLPWDHLKPLVQQLCAGLDYLHSAGLVHRNVKPANLILDSRAELKLADYHMSFLPLDAQMPAADQERDAILPCISPQQLKREPPSPLDDIYSLGATLYELLSGTPLFRTGDIAYQIHQLPPEPLPDRLIDVGLQNDIPPHITSLILACLAKDPDHRPPSVSSVAAWIATDPADPPEIGQIASALDPPGGAKGLGVYVSAVEDAAAFQSSLPESSVEPESEPEPEPEPEPESEPGPESTPANPQPLIARHQRTILGLIAALLLVLLGYSLGLQRQPNQEIPTAIAASSEATAMDEDASASQPFRAGLASPAIHAGEGPAFTYRYHPREALALDTNASNFRVRFFREKDTTSFLVPEGTTNNSVGRITYRIRPAAGYVIQDLRLSQNAALYTHGRIRGEYSVDGGNTFEAFFTTPPFPGEPLKYAWTANLSSLYASDVWVRYILHRYDGLDYNLQFLRDAPYAPAALEFSGSVIPQPPAAAEN